MAKKNFSKGINAFFDSTEKAENGESLVDKIEKRATFIINSDQLEKIKAIAFWERKTAKAILKQSLEEFFSTKGDRYIKEALNHYRVNTPDQIQD